MGTLLLYMCPWVNTGLVSLESLRRGPWSGEPNENERSSMGILSHPTKTRQPHKKSHMKPASRALRPAWPWSIVYPDLKEALWTLRPLRPSPLMPD